MTILPPARNTSRETSKESTLLPQERHRSVSAVRPRPDRQYRRRKRCGRLPWFASRTSRRRTPSLSPHLRGGPLLSRVPEHHAVRYGREGALAPGGTAPIQSLGENIPSRQRWISLGSVSGS